MDFFYPNYTNDMWRIMGQVFYGDKDRFVDKENKTFKLKLLCSFLEEKGIGLYDTATAVERTQGNASDSNLKVVERTDVKALLERIPTCEAIITTGQLATQLLQQSLGLESAPAIGQSVDFQFESRNIRCYRLPSSSRRLMGSVEQKAAAYAEILRQHTK